MNDRVHVQMDSAAAEKLLMSDDCAADDYLAAVGCAVAASFIDAAFSGTGAKTGTESWASSQIKKSVVDFSEFCGQSPILSDSWFIDSAFSFLAECFPAERAQLDTGSSIDPSSFGTMAYRIKAMSGTPDICGLFFSVLEQFTVVAPSSDTGRLVTIAPVTNELQGSNVISRLYCGAANWIGTMLAEALEGDNASAPTFGIALPFATMFKSFARSGMSVAEIRRDFACIAEQVFNESCATEVSHSNDTATLLSELLIRLMWAAKQHFFGGMSVSECMASRQSDDLSALLLVHGGAFSLLDAMDEAFQLCGNAHAACLRLSTAPWLRLTLLAVKEVCIKSEISLSVQRRLACYEQIHAALGEYERTAEEADGATRLRRLIFAANSEDELRHFLMRHCYRLGLLLPREIAVGA